MKNNRAQLLNELNQLQMIYSDVRDSKERKQIRRRVRVLQVLLGG